MNDQTDYVSSQSECSDSNHELEDTKFDNPRLDNLYQCNVTGVCQVSYKPRTTDTQRGKSLHCTAENSLPLPNF